MPSIFDKWVQDYKPLRQCPPVIPINPQRTSPPAPFCVHSIRANYQGEQSFRGRKYFPATCDIPLMREAVRFVPAAVNAFISARLQGENKELPTWYAWYHEFLKEFHQGRFWKYEHFTRWYCVEVAASLDEKFSSLRWTRTIWVPPMEMRRMIKDLQEYWEGNESAQSITSASGDTESVKTDVLVMTTGKDGNICTRIETLVSTW
ncbi:hypothetical protein Dda_9241 [Drechslerella dactyloides]|uniref:Uncharacterized protein n=1 Tax=Drechslerella dactyloides TaxID=74499 RepID=A0AAD6IPG7_DREDA|nr:hypothetical protein Dda_9241 [Drechslerella dactyloides]